MGTFRATFNKYNAYLWNALKIQTSFSTNKMFRWNMKIVLLKANS